MIVLSKGGSAMFSNPLDGMPARGSSTAAMSAVFACPLLAASTAFRSAELATLAGTPLQHRACLILPPTIATATVAGVEAVSRRRPRGGRGR